MLTSVALALIALIPFKIKTPYNSACHVTSELLKENNRTEAFIVQFRLENFETPYPPFGQITPFLSQLKKYPQLEEYCYTCPMLKNGVPPYTAQQLPSKGWGHFYRYNLYLGNVKADFYYFLV